MKKLLIKAFSGEFSSLVENLKAARETHFVLRRGGYEPSSAKLAGALDSLLDQPDVPCASLEAGLAFLFKAEPILELWEKGFRPCFSLAELVPALRHAGWQVDETMIVDSYGGALGPIRRGREKALASLYQTVTDQTLAGGPRQLKATLAWALLQCLKRLSEGSPMLEETAAASQHVLNTLCGHQRRVRPTTWAGELPFSFPQPEARCSTVVLLFTALRPWYLRRALRAIHRHWPEGRSTKLVISQDGHEPATKSLARSLAPEVDHWIFNGPLEIPLKDWLKGRTPYYRIAQHFAFALKRAFSEKSVERVVILEDDIEVGADFFDYMKACQSVLAKNDDLLAASAWNDNGHLPGHSPEKIHRTDCFSGLGWMLSRKTWEQLAPLWPAAYWDEWIREPEITEGRQCLRPGVSRVTNFGRCGTGASQFFDRFIAPNVCQEEPLRWSEVTLSPLTRAAYRRQLHQRVAGSHELDKLTLPLSGDSRIRYSDEPDFNQIAEELGIVPGFRPHAPRTAFEGIVATPHGGHWLYLIPKSWEDSEPGT